MISSSNHRPYGTAPFLHEIESMNGQYYEEYQPSDLEMKYQRLMHRNIQEALKYRQQFEHQWEYAIRRFNMLSDPLPDERLSNVLIPIIKIIINSRVASMTKGDMEVTYIPHYDEEDKVQLWKDASRYVGNKCNERHELQNAYLTMSLFGSAPLFDGYQSVYQTHRVPTNGGFREIVCRDPRQSMIFTKSLMPWDYLVSGGGRDHLDAPHHTYTAYMDYDSWVSEFARVPGYGGKPMYMHTKSVQPGKAYTYEGTDAKGYKPRSHDIASRQICVNYHFIPKMDLLMIESNGVLNWCGPNPYMHKRTPISLLRLHPQLESNGGAYSIYGMGDPWLLSGLDTMYQNVLNMFTDNFYFSNSAVIGVPQGLSLDLDDEEFYGGTVIRGGEGMVVNQLGKVDGASYNFMWKMLNDLLVWSSGVPFNQLVPEGNITAYELSKRLEAANERQAEVLRRNESYGFKIHEENKLSNIFQFLPEEEFYAISDPDVVDDMIKEGKIGDNDVVYEDGEPIMIRSFPMIETKGRVIEEKFVNGLPIIGQAKVVEKGRSGRLAARPENIRPMEWNRDHSIPDVMIDSSTCFGPKEEREAEDTFKAVTFGLQQNERAMKMKEPKPFNEEEMYEAAVKSLKKDPRKWLNKFTQNGTQMAANVNSRETEKQMRDMISGRDLSAEEQAMQAVAEQAQTDNVPETGASPFGAPGGAAPPPAPAA